MSASSIPTGYHAVTPWIISSDAGAMIEYLERAFGAQELGRVHNADGTIGHAEVRIGDSVVMLFDARPGWPPTPAFLRLYVDDGEEAFRRALEAGGTAVTEVTDLFFGDRVGRIRDPGGNLWWIQEHFEDLTPDQLAERATDPRLAEAMGRVQESLDREMTDRR